MGGVAFMSSGFPKHSECANFRDGICLLTGAKVDPNGFACANFTPKSTLPYQWPSMRQYDFTQQPSYVLYPTVPVPYMLPYASPWFSPWIYAYWIFMNSLLWQYWQYGPFGYSNPWFTPYGYYPLLPYW